MARLQVDTDQVAQIAQNLESLNTKLKEELERSKAVIDGLGSTWQGEAYNTTKESYDTFASKYFQNYYDLIDQYAKFLHTYVERGYFDTETNVSNLAQSFK